MDAYDIPDEMVKRETLKVLQEATAILGRIAEVLDRIDDRYRLEVLRSRGKQSTKISSHF